MSSDVSIIYNNSKAAFETIRNLSIRHRLEYVKKLKNIILQNESLIVNTIVSDTKKPSFEAYCCEFLPVISFLSFIEKTAKKVLSPKKVKTPFFLVGKTSQQKFDPLGCVLVITSWNYPFYLGIIPAITAFVCGNAVIIKPSEKAPLQGLWEKLFSQALFDPTWVQAVYADAEGTKNLISQKPDKIFFVGSTATGKKILEQASQYLIPVDLELGGKDAMIVCESANLSKAASAAIWGSFCNAGQVCSSIEKIYVHERIYEDFKNLLSQKLNRLIDEIHNKGQLQQLGNIISKEQFFKIKSHVDEALQNGATIVNHVAYEKLSCHIFDENNLFIYPLILENVCSDLTIVKEETFGPVVVMFKFKDEDTLIKNLNEDNYGLGASIWSANKQQINKMIDKLQVANICVNNVMVNLANPYLPFGGVKHSGFGRYKGKLGYLSFLNCKSIAYDFLPFNEIFWYPYTNFKYKILKFISKFV